MPIITILSDFGTRDPYVSEMKATIVTLCPSATLVDITHEIAKFNTRVGAFALAAASKYFPAGTVHLAVVDPGVGGPRRGILIDSQRAVYIGPDNGLLLPAALRDGIKRTYSIENAAFMRDRVSDTFHGRDVFAYAAGKIACGADPSEAGPEISDPVPGAFPKAIASPTMIRSEALVVDSFGNVVTTATEEDQKVAGFGIGRRVAFRAKRRLYGITVSKTYSDVPEGRAALLTGSHGFLEVAVNRGNAAKRFGVRAGDKLIFSSG